MKNNIDLLIDEQFIYKKIVADLEEKLKEEQNERKVKSIKKKINYNLGIITGLKIALKIIK